MSILEIDINKKRGENISEIEGFISDLNLSDCYQCGKCTAGCPVADIMDRPPQQMIRLVQLGALDEALNSSSFWVCLDCGTCSARCPRKVKISELMDGLKSFAKKKGIKPKEKENQNVVLFDELFLRNIEHHGRLYEIEFLGMNNLLSGHLFRDAEKGPTLLFGHKIHMIPDSPGSASKKDIKQIFSKTKKK